MTLGELIVLMVNAALGLAIWGIVMKRPVLLLAGLIMISLARSLLITTPRGNAVKCSHRFGNPRRHCDGRVLFQVTVPGSYTITPGGYVVPAAGEYACIRHAGMIAARLLRRDTATIIRRVPGVTPA